MRFECHPDQPTHLARVARGALPVRYHWLLRCWLTCVCAALCPCVYYDRYIAVVHTPLMCSVPQLRPPPSRVSRIVCQPEPLQATEQPASGEPQQTPPQPEEGENEQQQQQQEAESTERPPRMHWYPVSVPGSGDVLRQYSAQLLLGQYLPRHAHSAGH